MVAARVVEHAAVRVLDETGRWPSVGGGHAKGGRDEGLVVAAGHRPAHDLACAQIDQDGEIEPAGTSADEDHIADLTLVRMFGLELTANSIRRILVTPYIVRSRLGMVIPTCDYLLRSYFASIECRSSSFSVGRLPML